MWTPRAALARQITPCIPYYGYANAPTAKTAGRESITAQMVANCWLTSGVGPGAGHGTCIPSQIQAISIFPVINIYDQPVLVDLSLRP